ncbi:hypothetical protein WICMUC_004806 [Wickerhamomyces mucosus]|uniref:Uncharacterized protein n=1 Tax=Wickerhamomyces mucosus TaxID=1378264 RepID=A0A9P8PFD2_9ASCO|nr:hypothetical protein WICMUC_004806 [Wickerhamomyces mucosus]
MNQKTLEELERWSNLAEKSAVEETDNSDVEDPGQKAILEKNNSEVMRLDQMTDDEVNQELVMWAGKLEMESIDLREKSKQLSNELKNNSLLIKATKKYLIKEFVDWKLNTHNTLNEVTGPVKEISKDVIEIKSQLFKTLGAYSKETQNLNNKKNDKSMTNKLNEIIRTLNTIKSGSLNAKEKQGVLLAREIEKSDQSSQRDAFDTSNILRDFAITINEQIKSSIFESFDSISSLCLEGIDQLQKTTSIMNETLKHLSDNQNKLFLELMIIRSQKSGKGLFFTPDNSVADPHQTSGSPPIRRNKKASNFYDELLAAGQELSTTISKTNTSRSENSMATNIFKSSAEELENYGRGKRSRIRKSYDVKEIMKEAFSAKESALGKTYPKSTKRGLTSKKTVTISQNGPVLKKKVMNEAKERNRIINTDNTKSPGCPDGTKSTNVNAVTPEFGKRFGKESGIIQESVKRIKISFDVEDPKILFGSSRYSGREKSNNGLCEKTNTKKAIFAHPDSPIEKDAHKKKAESSFQDRKYEDQLIEAAEECSEGGNGKMNKVKQLRRLIETDDLSSSPVSSCNVYECFSSEI